MKTKVLVIEDDADLVSAYQTKLKTENFDVEVSYNGEDGLEKVISEKPDIILLDILLPKMDGREVLKKLKADKLTSNIPVIVLSNLQIT